MNRISRRWRHLSVTSMAIVAAGALVLSGCTPTDPSSTSGDEGAPVQGGNLTIQISGDPGGLDQNASYSIEAVNISELIFEKLFALDATNTPHPMLVDTYDLSDDRKTYTFHLRDGVTFSDGKPLTADDVVESLNYWLRVNAQGKIVAGDVESIEATDDLTVTLTLTKPRYPLIVELTGVGTGILEADTAKGLDATGFTQDQAIGTGPYKLQSWQPNEQLVVERNDAYSSLPDEESGYAGAKHAYLDTITFKIVADPDAVKNGLLTGQWLYASPTPDAYPELKANPDLVVHTLSGGNLNLLVLNHAWSGSIFSKPEARDALNLALDKPGIVAATGGSPDLTIESAALTPEASTIMYSTAGDEEYAKHDPEKAKALFAKAGYSDDKPIQILTTNAFPAFQAWATLVQDQLSSIGVKSEIQAYDFVTMLGQWQSYPDKWDIVPIFFNGDFPSPGQMNVLASAASPATDTHPEIADDRSQDLIDALADYNKVDNADDAHAIMDTITSIIARDKPAIILGMTTPYAAYSPTLKGYDNYWYVFWNSWIAE
ncbi:MAG: hypothetical protein KF761_06315 [Salinibacterium sp.]|nr:hypothetical protein [Salinibacterium sp.]